MEWWKGGMAEYPKTWNDRVPSFINLSKYSELLFRCKKFIIPHAFRGWQWFCSSFWSELPPSFLKREPKLTSYTLTSACIFSILFSIDFLKCWQGEFVDQSREYLVSDHFLYSHDLTVWCRGYTVGRNRMLVTLSG